MAYTTILQLNYDSSVCDKTVTLLLAVDEYLAHGSLWQIVLTVGRHYGWQTVSDGSDHGCITADREVLQLRRQMTNCWRHCKEMVISCCQPYNEVVDKCNEW